MLRFVVIICASIVAIGLLTGLTRVMAAAAPRSVPQAPLLALTETAEARPTDTPLPTATSTPPPTTPPETSTPTTPPETPSPTTPPETPSPTTPPETPSPTTPPETPVQEQQQTATLESVGTPTSTPTVPVPVTLPSTGASVAGGAPLMLILLALLVIAVGLLARSRRA